MKSISKNGWLRVSVLSVVVILLFLSGDRLRNLAGAITPLQGEGDDGILVIPIQLERDSYGLAMVDTLGQTLWIYEMNNRGPAHSRLRLLAARSFKYDRLLEEYNTAEPKPKQVKLLLEKIIKTDKKNFDSVLKEQDSKIPKK